ncbi:hypothetical protein FH972_021918 [Carpinus fangiana]|uniref:Protein arginine methyltransferase NDUFAF7 n=1 Tax=Carpinus fangiana TaxID=176857 RepID=A0A5N6KRA5_9ROSI|nr:hypothetical protein FH972_021918 [Carpinus fangiana]
MAAKVYAPFQSLSNSRSGRQLALRTVQEGWRVSCCSRSFSSTAKPASSRAWSTPLAKNLGEAITTTGPISIAKYMRECLTSPNGGYYTTQDAEGVDQFGKTGDFVTSPEISQIFGELVGVWFVAEWMSQGKRTEGVDIVELGPGRGTLMDDMLRTISRFTPMASSVESVRLIEASPTLRAAQHKLLCGNTPLEEIEGGGFKSKCKHLPHVSIIWQEDATALPKDDIKTPFIVAHEFFDALPINAFTSVSSKQISSSSTITTSSRTPDPRNTPTKLSHNEWRELLVSPTAPPSLLNPPKSIPPEFEISVAPTATPNSRLLPTLSSRYDALLAMPHSTIEICSEARSTTTTLTQLIGGAPKTNAGAMVRPSSSAFPMTKSTPSGAALIIDYGPANTVPVSTLRGIRAHRTCSPFESPGRVDLSADVDFLALAETALASSETVAVHGPVEQADWLGAMGGKERCDALLAKAGPGPGGEEIKGRIRAGWNRLVNKGPDGMGKVYKVMAIVPEDKGRRPVGFGGDI